MVIGNVMLKNKSGDICNVIEKSPAQKKIFIAQEPLYTIEQHFSKVINKK
jgi:hypothetical protein